MAAIKNFEIFSRKVLPNLPIYGNITNIIDIEYMFDIMIFGTFSSWVSTSNLLEERRFDKMTKRVFVIKILRYLSIILLLLIIMILVIKK